ncbi:hypothetical protein ACV331_35650, partial [Pseudomonas aeruginosa]
ALKVLTGKTRAWLMGQGHCVAAIDALNVLTGNLHPEQERAYADGEEGLNRLLQDFYGYAQAPNGAPAAPSERNATRVSPGNGMCAYCNSAKPR